MTQVSQFVSPVGGITYLAGQNIDFTSTILASTAFSHPNDTDFSVNVNGTYLVLFYFNLSVVNGTVFVGLAINGVPVLPSSVRLSPSNFAGEQSGSYAINLTAGDLLTIQNFGTESFTTDQPTDAATRITLIKIG